jgi:hypothetical protein
MYTVFLWVKWYKGVAICIGLLVLVRTCVLSEYMLLVSVVACVCLMGEMGCFEFWSFCLELICGYTLLMLMAMCCPAWMVYSFRHSVVGLLVLFLFSVLC